MQTSTVTTTTHTNGVISVSAQNSDNYSGSAIATSPPPTPGNSTCATTNSTPFTSPPASPPPSPPPEGCSFYADPAQYDLIEFTHEHKQSMIGLLNALIPDIDCLSSLDELKLTYWRLASLVHFFNTMFDVKNVLYIQDIQVPSLRHLSNHKLHLVNRYLRFWLSQFYHCHSIIDSLRFEKSHVTMTTMFILNVLRAMRDCLPRVRSLFDTHWNCAMTHLAFQLAPSLRFDQLNVLLQRALEMERVDHQEAKLANKQLSEQLAEAKSNLEKSESTVEKLKLMVDKMKQDAHAVQQQMQHQIQQLHLQLQQQPSTSLSTTTNLVSSEVKCETEQSNNLASSSRPQVKLSCSGQPFKSLLNPQHHSSTLTPASITISSQASPSTTIPVLSGISTQNCNVPQQFTNLVSTSSHGFIGGIPRRRGRPRKNPLLSSSLSGKSPMKSLKASARLAMAGCGLPAQAQQPVNSLVTYANPIGLSISPRQTTMGPLIHSPQVSAAQGKSLVLASSAGATTPPKVRTLLSAGPGGPQPQSGPGSSITIGPAMMVGPPQSMLTPLPIGDSNSATLLDKSMLLKKMKLAGGYVTSTGSPSLCSTNARAIATAVPQQQLFLATPQPMMMSSGGSTPHPIVSLPANMPAINLLQPVTSYSNLLMTPGQPLVSLVTLQASAPPVSTVTTSSLIHTLGNYATPLSTPSVSSSVGVTSTLAQQLTITSSCPSSSSSISSSSSLLIRTDQLSPLVAPNMEQRNLLASPSKDSLGLSVQSKPCASSPVTQQAICDNVSDCSSSENKSCGSGTPPEATSPSGSSNYKNKYSMSKFYASKYPTSKPVDAQNKKIYYLKKSDSSVKCRLCSKRLPSMAQFDLHFAEHLNARVFHCNWSGCSSFFLSNYKLKRHQRSHTGERPFECVHCAKSFTRSDKLKEHCKHCLSTGADSELTICADNCPSEGGSQQGAFSSPLEKACPPLPTAAGTRARRIKRMSANASTGKGQQPQKDANSTSHSSILRRLASSSSVASPSALGPSRKRRVRRVAKIKATKSQEQVPSSSGSEPKSIVNGTEVNVKSDLDKNGGKLVTAGHELKPQVDTEDEGQMVIDEEHEDEQQNHNSD